ncbi:protoheme IX farnesyltransferase [Synechococcus sp. PCC 7335]|uniref:heme o synthase n=1 Tax=Synechococcus sp. (strain ATCC 29403 / PCC 7335) TaxID=91464 RepID=UPI00017ECE29|nr:heme o synthase [Synechococcus sp. PCC 7335]EDX87400.1 protoheme IX farnesyltransferase [Synechococcus sp. PCC 7335]
MQTSIWTARRHDGPRQVIQSYWQLTKPRIIPLLLIETAAGMWVAGEGRVGPVLLLVTLLSGTLAAASAQTINCIYDRDIDYDMERTRHRPIPSGRIQPRDALLFALVMAMMSFSLLASFANLLSASLAMLGIMVYVGVYTFWLKRSSPQNIVIGGAAGAIPPLVGWAAVTGHLDLAAWVFFAIVFVWTPPHFWALAMLIKDDYAKVNVPMMPVVVGNQETAKQIWRYTVGLVPLTLVMVYPLGACGVVYGLGAAVLGGLFLKKAWQLRCHFDDRDLARGTFKYSIFYMMLLAVVMVLDSLPVTRFGVSALAHGLEGIYQAIPMVSCVTGSILG